MSAKPTSSDDLTSSQEALGQAIDRARGGEDRALAAQIRDAGERFCRQIFGCLRLTRYHDLDNKAYDKPIGEFHGTIRELIDLLGAVHLVTVEGQVYINDVRVRLDERTDTAVQLGRELKRHGVGGLSFHELPDQQQLRVLIQSFAQAPDPDTPRRALTEYLREAGASAVELAGVYRFRLSGERVMGQAVDADRIKTRALDLVDATVDALGASRMPNPLRLRRVVTEILEVGPEQEDLWEDFDGSSAFSNHTLRVSLLAMLIGRAAGLSAEALQDLGVLAMFHDVGYAAREGARPARDGQPAVRGYPPPFERHSSAGARMVIRQRGFHEAKIHRALATLEHHRDYNHPAARPTLFGRILRLAESYDTLLRPRGGGFDPPEALERMMPHAGTRYDPTLLQLLVNVLGRYPPGTMLMLYDGRIVRSIGATRSPETWDRPLCRLLYDERGRIPEKHTTVDLAEKGRVLRIIPTARRQSPEGGGSDGSGSDGSGSGGSGSDGGGSDGGGSDGRRSGQDRPSAS